MKSSATNVGEDKDSQKRQRDAVRAYAEAHGLDIVGEFYDAAVSGADSVTSRKGFNAMLAAMRRGRCLILEVIRRVDRDERDALRHQQIVPGDLDDQVSSEPRSVLD